MFRFSLTQLLMGVALLAIGLLFLRTDGCGRRYSLIECLSFSPDGSRLAVTRIDCRDAQTSMKFYKANLSRTISLLDTQNGELLKIVHQDYRSGNHGPAFGYIYPGRVSAVFSPLNGSIVASEFGGGELLFLPLGEQGGEPPARVATFGPCDNLAISPSGRYVATSGILGVTIFDVSNGHVVVASIPTAYHAFIEGTPLLFFDDESRLAMLNRQQIEVWDLDTRQLVAPLALPTEFTECFSLAPGDTMIACDRNIAKRFDFSGQELTTYDNTDHVSRCLVSNDGTFVVFMNFNKVVVCDLQTGKRRHSFHRGYSSAMAISPDGKSLAIGSQGNIITLIDLASGQVLWETSPPGRYRWPWTLPLGCLIVWTIIARFLARRTRRQTQIALEALS